MTTPLLLLAVILHVCAAAVEALVFDVPSGSSKRLTEELRRGALSRTSYRVAPESTSAADPRVSARVTGPRGEELHLAEAAERGELRFQAAEDGEHTACFWTPSYERGAVVSVDVQWDTTGASARGTPPAVADGRIAEEQASVTFQSIAEELKKLEDSARLIHEEMISLHQSEREMQTQPRHGHKDTRVYPGVAGHVRRCRRIAAVASEDFLSETAYTVEVRTGPVHNLFPPYSQG